MTSTWIGTTTILANAGQYITVTLFNGKTITAKAIQRISSSRVGVFRNGNSYYVVNAGNVSRVQKKQNLSFTKTRKQGSVSGSYSVAMIVRVKKPGVRISCNCTRNVRYSYFNGQCIQTCNGPYTSMNQCREENPDFNPWYSIGYFNPGYMQLLGGNNYNLGFFYPISGQRNGYPYCFSGTMDTVDDFLYNTVSKSTITGDRDNLYETRRAVLPFSDQYPYHFYYPFNDAFFLRHWGYIPAEVTSEMLGEWESMYLISFNLYRNDGAGVRTAPFNFENIPFEINTRLLNPDGSFRTVPDPDAPGGIRQVFGWHGMPNWFWRQVNITAIAIENTIYYADASNMPITRRQIFERNYWTYRVSRGLAPDDFSAVQFQRFYAGNTNLPASIITRTYQGSQRPYPPVAQPNISQWTLLWDTQTCPSDDSPNPDTYTYDTYAYYYYDGGEPVLLETTRSDENVVFYITNIDGLSIATLKYGVVTENQRNEFCKATVYSGGETTIYTNPNTIPFNELDWQGALASSWSGVLPRENDPSQNPCFSQDLGTWDLLNQRLFGHSTSLGELVTYPDPNNPGQTIEEPLSRALVNSPLTINVPVLEFSYGVDDNDQPICQLSELLEIEIDTPPVTISGVNPQNIDVVKWSIWVNP